MKFTSLSGLKAAIEKDVGKVLRKEVFDAVRMAEQSSIYDTVYDEYPEQVQYVRRAMGGGLSDEDNIKAYGSGTTLIVRNEAPPSDQGNTQEYPNWRGEYTTTSKDLAETVEYGSGYDYPHSCLGASFLSARPFTANTVRDLNGNKRHVIAMENGLSKLGYQVK